MRVHIRLETVGKFELRALLYSAYLVLLLGIALVISEGELGHRTRKINECEPNSNADYEPNSTTLAKHKECYVNRTSGFRDPTASRFNREATFSFYVTDLHWSQRYIMLNTRCAPFTRSHALVTPLMPCTMPQG